jgi:hypothetical protein
MMVFGGRRALTEQGDTWLWDGTAWTQVAQNDPGRPAPRYGAAMAYDEANRVVVLFGGRTGQGTTGTVFGDTYVWDGSNWTQRSASGPQPRFGHAMAYDPAGQRIVMFGGTSASGLVPPALWVWTASGWTQPATTGGPPAARAFHALAYDGLQQVVLYGGLQGFTAPGETWLLRGATWVPVCTSATCALPTRYSHAMAYDQTRQRVLLQGGRDAAQVRIDGTWQWDGTTSTWTQIVAPGPSGRELHTLVYDRDRRRSVLYGGMAGPDLAETWHAAWVGIPCNTPADCGTGFCVDRVCCRAACTDRCHRCDQPNPFTGRFDGLQIFDDGQIVFGPSSGVKWIDGVCRSTPGRDPDGECGSGYCGGTCGTRGTCRYPGLEKSCGLCDACDGKGSCGALPLEDHRCDLLKCSRANSSCRTYDDVRRCRAVGDCFRTYIGCTSHTDRPDGEACDEGGKTCKSGFCGGPP